MDYIYIMDRLVLFIFGAQLGLVIGKLCFTYKKTKPVVGICTKVLSKKSSFFNVWFPCIEYDIDGKAYTTYDALDPSLLRTTYKVGSRYNLRYKIEDFSKASRYHTRVLLVIAVLLVICICMVFSLMGLE